MRLRRLDLTRYGKFTEDRLDFGKRPEGAPDLHIVYGRNESGKSTTLAAWLDLLFGVDARTPYAFLHPYATMEIGGALEFGGATHELRRVKRQSRSLLDAQGRPADEGALAAALPGLTRETYAAMFSLDDATLEQGGEAILDSKGELGALLFSAGAGLAEAARALDEMTAQAAELHRKKASKTRLAELKRRVAELKSERDRIDVQASAYERLVSARRAAEGDYEAAAQALGAARKRHAELTRALRARPLCEQYDRDAARLIALAGAPRPPRSWFSEQRALRDDELLLSQKASEVARRIESLSADIARIAPERSVLDLGPRIDDLGLLDARWLTAQADLPKREAALAQREVRIAATRRTLGVAADLDPHALLVAAPVAATLRDLIEARSGVEAALVGARAEVEAAREALAQLTDDKARLAEDADEALKLGALQAALAEARGGDRPAELRRIEREAQTRADQARAALAALAPWRGEIDALAALVCPDARRIEGWRAAANALDARRAGLARTMGDLEGADREERARIAAARAAAAGLDDADADAARAARDAAWSRHRAALDQATAQAFETAMRGLDALQSARLAKADDVARLRGAAAEAALRAARLETARAEWDQIARDGEALSREIEREAAIPLDPTPASLARIAALESWLAARLAALTKAEDARRAKAALDDARAESGRARVALAAALERFGIAPRDAALDALAAVADNALVEAASRRAAREAADKAAQRAARELALREKRAEEASNAREEWERRWREALAKTWFGARGFDPAAARAALDALADLPGDVREQTLIARQVETMRRDQEAYRVEVAVLFAALGEEAPASPRDGAARLSQRLAVARRESEIKASKSDDLAALVAERGALDEARRLHDARKTERFGFFGVADLAALDAALEACRERDSLEQTQRERAARIVDEMQATSLDVARAALEGLDIEATRGAARALEEEIALLEARARDLFAQKARAQDALAAVGGDVEAARIEAERRVALIEMEEVATTWLRLRAGALIGAHALRQWRDAHRSAMMRRASEAFREITGGAYLRLSTRMEKERETLIAMASDGGSKLVGDLSKGTRFQLYLALRLAGYEEFARARGPVPFVADDILETFDEPRAEQTFRLLAEMARGGQVIYLTHHRHICDLALRAAPGARLHELGLTPPA